VEEARKKLEEEEVGQEREDGKNGKKINLL
jgi:hypothetical protein